MAASRAAHVEVDGGVVLNDRLARYLAGEVAERRIAQTRTDPTVPDSRIAVAARSRFAEDTLATAHARGVGQYVLLGAGLDSFAYRPPDHLRGLRVFEVDKAASQVWKRQRLDWCGIGEPASVVFVPVEVETEDLDAALAAGGFDPMAPTVVDWLGVTFYLAAEAIDRTLAGIRRWAPGSWIVFDYLLPEDQWDALGEASFMHELRRTRDGADTTEPWVSFFTTEDVEELLGGHGYVDVDHLDHERIAREYLEGTPVATRPWPWSRAVRARVPA